MISSVSPVKIPTCSFRGVEGDDKKVPDVSGKIDSFVKEGIEATDSVASGMEAAAAATGKLGTSALGLAAIFKNPFAKVYEFFTDVVMENGKPVIKDVFDSHGNKKIDPDTGKAVTKVLRKANWKKIGIAGGLVAAGVALLAIAKKVIDSKKAVESKTEDVKLETDNKSEEV